MSLPNASSTCKIHNPIGVWLLTHLRLALSHVNEHKFRYNFADCVNPICSCSIKSKATLHISLHCHNFLNIRRESLNQSFGVFSV